MWTTLEMMRQTASDAAALIQSSFLIRYDRTDGISSARPRSSGVTTDMDMLDLFMPLTKVDLDLRMVHGVATAEAPDRAGEICDYASTKPYFEAWSAEAEAASGGKDAGYPDLLAPIGLGDAESPACISGLREGDEHEDQREAHFGTLRSAP